MIIGSTRSYILSRTPDTDTLFPATFADQLQYRGTIMSYASANPPTPFSYWAPAMILAYFTSNVDKNRNLSMAFEQTRARVYEIYGYFNKHRVHAHLVDKAYLTSVLEYQKFPGVFDPYRPVQFQVEFVKAVRDNPEAFIIRNKVQNSKLLDSSKKVMHELRNNQNSLNNMHPVRRAALDFLFPAPPPSAPRSEPSKPWQRGKARGKGTVNKQMDTTALDPAHRKSGSAKMTYNYLPFRERAMDNILLTGLVHDMPGVHTGETLSTIEEASVFDGTSMSEALDGLSDRTDADGDAVMGEDGDEMEEEVDELIIAATDVDDDDGFFIDFLPAYFKET